MILIFLSHTEPSNPKLNWKVFFYMGWQLLKPYHEKRFGSRCFKTGLLSLKSFLDSGDGLPELEHSYPSSSSWSLLHHCFVPQRSPLGSLCDVQPWLQEYNQHWNLLFRFSAWDQGQGKAAGLEEGGDPEALYRLKSTIALARQLCLNGSAQREGRTFVAVFWLYGVSGERWQEQERDVRLPFHTACMKLEQPDLKIKATW